MVAGSATETRPRKAPADHRQPCCSLYHRAVELVGKRWTGAILLVLMEGRLRFSEIRALVPDLSDRLLSERLKELEAEGIVRRNVIDEIPVRVEYERPTRAARSSPRSARSRAGPTTGYSSAR